MFAFNSGSRISIHGSFAAWPVLLVFAIFAAVPAVAQPDPGYYDAVDDSSAHAMRDSLHGIIDDHSRFSYTSGATDTWDVLEIADEDRDNSGNIVTIYSNASFAKQGGGNSGIESK